MAAVARNRAISRLAGSPTTWFSAAFILALILMATVGPYLFGDVDPNTISMSIMAPPSAEFPFGTDELGRDVLQYIVHGAQVSLYVGFSAAFAATILGGLIGAVSGYVGGRIDTLIMRVTEIFQSMPTFVLAALIVALLGPGNNRVILVIALLSWPQTARLMRGEVLRVKRLDFVTAARCLGQSETVILIKEVVPNCLAPVIALGTLTVAQAILLEASLSFFGLTNPDTISWGRILTSGQRYIFQAWWLSLFPGMAIFLTVFSFNVLGDSLRQALDPKS
ncbi:ABC transporter permease [uncultured Ferrovibrio sp.]|jgi:peptide/nickel transport system permease protein|uniref:ABC transporter permease n=1 Tax=uncultured Ferrovibrio sp. TaxID=1576913 RepID=UPI00263656FF|nr:ABC transporter permease [uncultured Ferrovibrio sp.]